MCKENVIGDSSSDEEWKEQTNVYKKPIPSKQAAPKIVKKEKWIGKLKIPIKLVLRFW